ncbi:ATP-grasp fold amidoligase family protein [Tissierella pigra]|uniref:Carboxylate--amine ligase n=1 Tax=Tissierella pigra TaxID=2607614 RepID=A0A6N7XKM3_9FIRM|nr:ATP-grasp fold amidoligase family protein [Tissierella pigra]MSU02126.1 carboxylate--amine ligase [Tissierella pigra]
MLKIKSNIKKTFEKSNFTHGLYLSLKRIYRQCLLIIPDEIFAKYRYYKRTGKKLNLTNPKTFNEKLWWLKLNNKDPLLTNCSDKVKVRKYVEECGLGHILNEIYGVYDNANDIDFDNLENAFIKTNHGSGTNIIWDKNRQFDKQKFRNIFNKALEHNYYLESREWNYKNIEPKIIVERILEDKENKSLIDYRFLCFNGVVKIIFVDIETAAEDGSHSPHAKRNVYDRSFNYLNIKVKREPFEKSLVSKPDNFNKMVEYAEILSKPFPFCRVDLYNINEEIYFGEITFYPGGATQIVEPEEWELKMGEWIDLKNEKIILENE